MAKEAAKQKAWRPTHSWGFLAKDPWMKVGPETEAYRDVLRRYWRRNGGDDALFDRLIPPPSAPRQTRNG